MVYCRHIRPTACSCLPELTQQVISEYNTMQYGIYTVPRVINELAVMWAYGSELCCVI